MPSSSSLAAGLALAGFLSAGCTSWQRAPASDGVLPADLSPRERRELWVGGRSVVAHGLEIHGDTMRLIPAWLPVRCDKCAVAWPLSAVDSVRARKFDSGKTAACAGGILVDVALLYALVVIDRSK